LLIFRINSGKSYIMFRSISLSCFFLLLGSFSFAQVPNGSWRDHLPYSNAKKIVEIGSKIYCATNGGMFSYNKTDNSLQRYSKVNGLSDMDISTFGYSEETQTLLVAYMNGNLDLIRNDSIYNLPDIKIKTIPGDKFVNNVYFSQGYAYLACSFGVVLVDLNRIVIKDTYFFGPGGSQIKVNDITSDGSFLYAATLEGIYKADVHSPNLVDFNAWSRLTDLPDMNTEYKNIIVFNDKLFTYYKNPATNLDDIITIDNSGWKKWDKGYSDYFMYLARHRNYLIFSSLYRTDIYDENEQQVTAFGSSLCQHAIMDENYQVWFADPEKGLGKVETNGNSYIVPNGPAYRDVGDLVIKSGTLWAGGGTDASKWSSRGAYTFSNEKWSSVNNTTVPELEGFLNISQVAIDPLDTGHVYGGSLGYGIVEFQNGKLVNMFDETDGILEPVPGYGHGFVFVKGINFDASGNLWISTSLSDHPVYEIKKNKTWQKMEFDFTGFGVGTFIGDILPTSFNQQWLLIERIGVMVFSVNENDGSLTERTFTVKNQMGDLIDRLYSLAEDRDGNIWIGTGKGPIIYYNPGNIFEEDEIIGYQVKIPRNDGTFTADILLATEKINAIAVDGGNRKWLGTENSGVFLVSEDGTKEIHHFTTNNSPLPSNMINSIAINHSNGEVFFGTDKGIISFKGQSTEGSEDFSHTYVFPNPVRENYQGDITITGLVEDVNVKITDISGNLVFETKALGGQAIWNGKNFNGQKVHTGVYLVFCSNEDGSKTFVTKLLFIH
jgi:hypothetical protein